MYAVKLVGNSRVDVINVPIPKIEEDWVLVKVKASAICGSDLYLYFSPTGWKFTPGHEVAGEVVEVGKKVTRIKPGDRIAIHSTIGCGYCKYCRRGDWIFFPI